MSFSIAYYAAHAGAASGGSPLALIVPDPLPFANVGEPYFYQLEASGGVPPYTFSVSAGALPAGLSLDSSTGIISGTPTSSGSLTAVTFSVTDSGP